MAAAIRPIASRGVRTGSSAASKLIFNSARQPGLTWTLYLTADNMNLAPQSVRPDKEVLPMPSSHDFLLVEHDASTAIVTMNRPERRNALSVGLMRQLIDCLTSMGNSPEVRAIILAANGPAFSSGHDLSELRDRTIPEYRQVFDVCTDLMTLIQTIPQPVIAEVAGIATAAGCQLVATCDLAVASEQATFATPGVRIGLFCTTPMVALTRAVGRKRALEMLLTGRSIDASEAEQWGLVNRVVPADNLREQTRALAALITEASPLIVSIGKRAFYAQIDQDQPKAYSYAKEIMTGNAMAEDAQEGIGAFLEKRKPRWRGL
jgi:enoyl-CoA hydratase/carnithine racemase